MLASLGPERSIGTQEFGAALAERVCNMEKFIRLLEPITRESVETVVSHNTAPEMGAPVLQLVTLDTVRHRVPGTQPVQNQGLGRL